MEGSDGVCIGSGNLPPLSRCLLEIRGASQLEERKERERESDDKIANLFFFLGRESG